MYEDTNMIIYITHLKPWLFPVWRKGENLHSCETLEDLERITVGREYTIPYLHNLNWF